MIKYKAKVQDNSDLKPIETFVDSSEENTNYAKSY